jgi:hypothetical protein
VYVTGVTRSKVRAIGKKHWRAAGAALFLAWPASTAGHMAHGLTFKAHTSFPSVNFQTSSGGSLLL